MKKLLCLSILMVCIHICAQAQVPFENNLGWSQVLEKARKESKLIFLHLENNQCSQCNEVATQGFSSTMMKEKFSVNFVCLRLNTETPAGKELAAKYEFKGFAASLFLDEEGNILHRYNATTSDFMKYMQLADEALSKRHEKPLRFYEEEFTRGNRAPEFLEAYILKRKSNSLNVQDLLETYVDVFPADSLTNFRIAKFIYLQGPTLDNRAYKAMRAAASQRLIDSIYRSMPVSQAVAMNSWIINASLQKAIEKKDILLMHQTAGFARGTYGNDTKRGQDAYIQNFLKYYYAVKDAQNYIHFASLYYDERNMRISVDSLKRIDQQAGQTQIKMRNEGKVSSAGLGNPGRETVAFAPPSQRYHIELNQAAMNYWELATQIHDLEKALTWSKRAMELYEELNKDHPIPMSKGNPYYMDTYARLLYKLSRREEAIEWQTKAIDAQKITGKSTRTFEETLEKIKEGKL